MKAERTVRAGDRRSGGSDRGRCDRTGGCRGSASRAAVCPGASTAGRYRGWNALVLAMIGGRAWLVVLDVGDLPRVAAPRRPGPARRAGHARRVVEADRPHEPRAATRRTQRSEHRRSLFARTFTVFAAEQVDGVEHLIVRRTTSATRPGGSADAEGYFAARSPPTSTAAGAWPATSPRWTPSACPPSGSSTRPADFYSTSAHEHVHWTGHRVPAGSGSLGPLR